MDCVCVDCVCGLCACICVCMCVCCVFVYMCACVWGVWGWMCALCETSVQGEYIDGFHSIFHHQNWRAKISCDAIIQQHGDVMPSSCHSVKMLLNLSVCAWLYEMWLWECESVVWEVGVCVCVYVCSMRQNVCG